MTSTVARVARSTLVFAGAGPLIGYLCVLAFAFALAPRLSFFSWALIPMAIPAYFIGLVPAAVTGFIAGVLSGAFTGKGYYLAVGLTGGIVSCVCAKAFSLTSSAFQLTGPFFLPAVVAAVVCARLLREPPNNSSKPTPLRGAA